MKLQRLSGRKVNDYLKRKGNVWKGKTMIIRYLTCRPKHPNIDSSKPALYVGTLASTRLHKSAVKRNRMRRRCREALRKQVKEIDKLRTAQLLITPKIASLTCSSEDINKDVSAFLSHLL